MTAYKVVRVMMH